MSACLFVHSLVRPLVRPRLLWNDRLRVCLHMVVSRCVCLCLFLCLFDCLLVCLPVCSLGWLTSCLFVGLRARMFVCVLACLLACVSI